MPLSATIWVSMKFRWAFLLVLCAGAVSGWAQTPTAEPAQPPVSSGAPAPPAAPVPPLLENHGKPMVLPFRCTAEDIQWAGLTCTETEPCQVFLELASAASPASGRLLVTGNIHTDSVTLYSTLLASENSGQTWAEVYDRIRGAGLDRMQFIEPDAGWVSGQELFPIPQDPFLLLTADGGKTWERHPVFGDSAENRFGTIQQFVFSDKNTGSLIVDRGQGNDIDRYALYESKTGGQSWDIRQESDKPLRLKLAPPVSDWRVRVDAVSHAFEIEHRQGERWIPAAAFAVRLDPCKPPPPPADSGVGVGDNR
jgi:hypothetical protein